MRKLLLLLIICCAVLAIFSCSKSPVDTNSGNNRTAVVLSPRPEFVDTRPAAVIQNSIVRPTDAYTDAFMKKPPKPPPDTTGGDDPNPNPAHKYAYVVGISDYEGTANDLQYCDDDAREMRTYLISQGFTVQIDLDQSATADNITAGLEWLVSQASPGDEIAFCYSGHGYNAPTYGSSIISTDLYYITHGYVMQYLNAVDCTKKLITLDACVIGDFHDDVMSGTFMATASDNTNSYDAPTLQNGAWTYFFLEAAEDLNYVFAEEVAPYAESEMRAWAKPYHVRVSPKHTDAYDGMFDM